MTESYQLPHPVQCFVSSEMRGVRGSCEVSVITALEHGVDCTAALQVACIVYIAAVQQL